MNNKNGTTIAVIGVGAVGSTAAYTIAIKNLASEIILIDANDEKELGEALDIGDSLNFTGTGSVRTGDFKDAAQADIVVITAGSAQKPGETRLDLAARNKAIMTSILKEIGPFKQEAIVIIVSNPVDVMTKLAQDLSGLPKSRVFGTGTCLDTARLRTTLARKMNVSPSSVTGFVLGEHGDSGFVGWSTVTIGDKPASEVLSKQEMDELEHAVKNEVYNIIKLKGATFFGIAAVIADIIECILFNQNKVLPLTHILEDWNGVSEICLGSPAVLGSEGVVKAWPLELPPEEKDKFVTSAETIKSYL